MKFQTLWRNRRVALSEGDLRRFHAFTFAKARPALTLLTFSMPLLLAVGWLRDYAILGNAATLSLYVRLALIAALLALAVALWRSGFQRRGEVIGVLYSLGFGVAIAMLTALDPTKLSLTHVSVMLMAIILLPFAPRLSCAIGVAAGLCLPMFVLLAHLRAPPSLWLAFALYVAAGVAIGFAQRRANLDATLDIFVHRQRLLRQLHLDPLTGVSNRGGWEIQATRLLRESEASGIPLAVVYFDVDRFKAINDNHGHAAGDAVLHRLGQVMKRHLRGHDVVARVGGEEFVVLLPETDAEGAHRVAERIRRAVATMDAPHPVTISGGVAMILPGETLESATHRADSAMLNAKLSGRNRIVPA